MSGPKGESPAATGQFAETSSDNAEILAQSWVEDDELVNTFVVLLGMYGHVVHRLTDGGFIVAVRGISKHCPDVRALVEFARQLMVVP